MIKKIILILFIGIFLLTGCSNKDDVIIYSSMEEERNQELIKQVKEKFPEISVTVQHMATGNSAAKIKNEGTSIEADIIVDLETAHMENLKGNFANITSFDTSNYIEGINQSEKYIIWTKSPVGIIINKQYLKDKKLDAPKTYEDLLNPKYKDIIAMPDPKTSGSGYAFYLNVVNIMGEKQAIEYFKKLKNNLREFTTSGSGPTNLLKQNEIGIALGMISQGVQAINDGYNFEIVELETGTPYNTTSISIIKGRETDENVKKIFSWLISEYGKYDKENFMPAIILKEQENKIDNYPSNLKDADMTNIENIEEKNKLTEKWEEVNG